MKQTAHTNLWTTIVLVFLPMLGALCIDMYLPAYPKIAASFGVGEDLVNLSVSTYLIGLGLGQIAYGLLADRFGKKPTLIAGVMLFIVSSFVCTVAPNITTFLIARMGQALGVCSCAVISYALVADIYKDKKSTKIFAILSGVGILSPVLAPSIGGCIVQFFDWRVIFMIITALGVVGLVNIILFIPETITHETRTYLALDTIFANAKKIMAHRVFRSCVFSAALLSAITYTWVTFSPKVLLTHFNVKPDDFGLFFLVPAIGSAIGAFLTAKFFHFREKSSMIIGLSLVGFSTGFLVLTVLLDMFITPDLMIVLIAINFIGTGIIFPHFVANAMALFSDNTGLASGIIGLIRSLSGAAIGIVTSSFYEFGYEAMSVLLFSLAFLVAINVFLVPLLRRSKVIEPPAMMAEADAA